MNIHVINSIAEAPETLIIPSTTNGNREKVLQLAEELTGVEAQQIRRDFSGKAGTFHLIYRQNGHRLYLLGLGATPGFGETLKSFRIFSYKNRQSLSAHVGIHFVDEKNPTMLEAAVNGLMLSIYQIGKFKTAAAELPSLSEEGATITLIVDQEDEASANQAAHRALQIAETQMSVFDLVNAPSNKKLPEDLGAWARHSGEKYGYEVQIFDREKIERTGLQALLAVNQGSAHDPVFIVMEYRPPESKEQSLPTIGLVGKGVTFDTGGLSIKPSNNMHLMKSDMGGAAAVFGAMECAARLQLPVHLVGVVPATDNSVDARSVKPSDVIDSHSGKTIEIIDTDAEGRLILADGLSYIIQEYHPDVLVDLATLTGSAVRTLGYHAAGLFTKNEALGRRLYLISQSTGERVWQLPLWDLYKEDLQSDVADVRNFSGKPVAGAITAAKFLEVFTYDHPAWAHLDIAGVAFQDSEFATQKSATGYGVRLLVELLESLAKTPLTS